MLKSVTSSCKSLVLLPWIASRFSIPWDYSRQEQRGCHASSSRRGFSPGDWNPSSEVSSSAGNALSHWKFRWYCSFIFLLRSYSWIWAAWSHGLCNQWAMVTCHSGPIDRSAKCFEKRWSTGEEMGDSPNILANPMNSSEKRQSIVPERFIRPSVQYATVRAEVLNCLYNERICGAHLIRWDSSIFQSLSAMKEHETSHPDICQHLMLDSSASSIVRNTLLF